MGGTAVAVLAVARGRWASVLLVVIALRMLLDPATKTYYEAGLMVGTAVFDLALAVSAFPIVTLSAFVAVYLPDYAFAHAPMVRGLERTAALLALIAVGLLPSASPESRSGPRRPGRHPRTVAVTRQSQQRRPKRPVSSASD